MAKIHDSAYIGEKMRNYFIFPAVTVAEMSDITDTPTRTGLDLAVISGGTIVNITSRRYGLLENRTFYGEVERRLEEAGLDYVRRTVNRLNRSFVADYILSESGYRVTVKNGADGIRPMLRFVNSYDGSEPTSGHFGFFREVCSNGLHVATSKVGFRVRHTTCAQEIAVPRIAELVERFYNNEFYEIRRKFEVLAERPITDLREFVRMTAKATGLFRYEMSDKNPEPGLNARTVIATAEREAAQLGEPVTRR